MTHIPRAGYGSPGGKPIKFDTLNFAKGYLATDDPEIIRELSALATAKKGGIEEITAAQYEANYVKKKPSSGPPPRQWREELAPGMNAPDTLTPPTITKVSVSPPPPQPVAGPVADNPTEVKVRTAKKAAVKKLPPPDAAPPAVPA